MAGTTDARIDLRVTDDSGQPLPFRAEWGAPGAPPAGRAWSDNGSASISLPAGPAYLLVRRGIDHDAVRLDLDLRPGVSESRQIVLKRRFDLRALG